MVKAKNPIAMKDADKEDAILIAVTRNGEIFLSPGNKRLTVDELSGKVRDLLTNKLDKTVYVKADMRAKYERVTDVVDNLRAAGVDQLGLLTEQQGGDKKPATPPTPAN
jgi:biopolymer transport protein ExbD/biopolymer transport protein TolR